MKDFIQGRRIGVCRSRHGPGTSQRRVSNGLLNRYGENAPPTASPGRSHTFGIGEYGGVFYSMLELMERRKQNATLKKMCKGEKYIISESEKSLGIRAEL